MAVLAGQVLTSDDFNEGPNSYTPVLTATTTNPTLGSGATQSGWWYRIGRHVVGGARILFGSTGMNSGSGGYRVSLPVAADLTMLNSSSAVGHASCIGSGVYRDNSALSSSGTFAVNLASATTIFMQATGGGAFTSTVPITWVSSDGFSFNFDYLAAE